jgi:hypothetical protein
LIDASFLALVAAAAAREILAGGLQFGDHGLKRATTFTTNC